MVFGKIPDRRTLHNFPDKRELAEPLAVPDVHTVLLRLTMDGNKSIARWKIPWFAVVFTALMATGSVTIGVLYGHSVDRISTTMTYLLLGAMWLLIIPFVGYVAFYRSFRRALKKPEHLVLDLDAHSFTVACVDADDEVIPFDRAMALVQVSRWIESGHGGRVMARVDDFSIVFETAAGSHEQLPLYSIQDSGKREEQLRRWTNALPRALGCDRIRVAFDRKGKLQGQDPPG